MTTENTTQWVKSYASADGLLWDAIDAGELVDTGMAASAAEVAHDCGAVSGFVRVAAWAREPEGGPQWDDALWIDDYEVVPAARPSTVTALQLNEWTSKTGQTRRYVNNWADLIGLNVTRYKSGNISGAALSGQDLSNAEAGRILAAKVWLDADDQVHVDYLSARSITADVIMEAVTAAYQQTQDA